MQSHIVMPMELAYVQVLPSTGTSNPILGLKPQVCDCSEWDVPARSSLRSVGVVGDANHGVGFKFRSSFGKKSPLLERRLPNAKWYNTPKYQPPQGRSISNQSCAYLQVLQACSQSNGRKSAALVWFTSWVCYIFINCTTVFVRVIHEMNWWSTNLLCSALPELVSPAYSANVNCSSFNTTSLRVSTGEHLQSWVCS